VDDPSPRIDNSERVKLHFIFLKIFSRTNWLNAIILNTNYLSVKVIQVCSNKGPGSLKRGDNHKNKKNGVGSFKNLILKLIISWAPEDKMEMKYISSFDMDQGYSGERCGLWASCLYCGPPDPRGP
jgi:hypothetical protein